jgi:hypothetical protein
MSKHSFVLFDKTITFFIQEEFQGTENILVD